MFKMLSCLLLALLTALSGAGYGERFLASSDLHLTEDRALHASALGALGTAAGDFDGLILLGDTANNAHDAEHAHALEFLDGLGTAAYVIPGNHDLTARLRPGDFARLYGACGWDGAFARDAETASCAVTVVKATGEKTLKSTGSNGTVKLAPGMKLQLVPKFATSKGWKIKSVKSSNTKVATVDKTGVVTAVAEGKATITVLTKNNKKATLTIKVIDPYKATKVVLNKKKTVTLKKGKTLKLAAAVSPSTAVTSLTWKSSKPSVAKVDQNGKVTALKKGTCYIGVRMDNGKIAKVKIKVS